MKKKCPTVMALVCKPLLWNLPTVDLEATKGLRPSLHFILWVEEIQIC